MSPRKLLDHAWNECRRDPGFNRARLCFKERFESAHGLTWYTLAPASESLPPDERII